MLLRPYNGLFCSGMVGETGEASERFLRSAAKGEIDPRAALKRSASNARSRAAEPAKSKPAGGPRTCGAIANKARSAAGLLRTALAGLAEAAEDQHVRHVSSILRGLPLRKSLSCYITLCYVKQRISTSVT